MSVRKAVREHSIRELVELGPPVAERMALRADADSQVVASYVLTRGAAHALEAISGQEQARRGAVFWIGGPAGTGKTHFLNYVLALDRKAGPITSETRRRITIGLEFAGSPTAEEIEARLLEAIAREITGSRNATLWRQTHDADALMLALSEARRRGFGSVTIGMDFGEASVAQAAAYFETLAQVSSIKTPRLVVIAAGREAPPGQTAFEVGPNDRREETTVAIGRARRVSEDADKIIEQFYGDAVPRVFDPRAIFPFDDNSVETIRALAGPPVTIAEIARLARDVLAPRGDNRVAPYRRPITAADLMTSAEVCARVEQKLGDGGRAAFKIACEAAGQFDGDERKLAVEIVRTLALAHFSGESPRLKLVDLLALMPSRFDGTLSSGKEIQQTNTLLQGLAGRSSGVIRFENGTAYFNIRDCRAAEVAAFNAALSLIRKFDPSITEAQEVPELIAKLKRLGDAMANALEAAHRTRQALAPVIAEVSDRLPDERNSVLPDYDALAAAGPEALIRTAADPERRERAIKTIHAYEAMAAAAAAAAPRLWQMRDYVRATGLEFKAEDTPASEERITELETQCQLLESQLNPGVLLGGQRNIDALQARFQQFRWSYVQEYRIAHERWRAEMKKLHEVLADAQRHFDALRRLDRIAALGPPEGQALEPPLADIQTKIAICDFDAPLSPERNPRCPGCGFILGTRSPASELNDLFARIKAALGRRLEALSKTAIARLIREHDSSHRLDGFLKITQAAQTDALVRVLDDDLAHYLARLIDENLARDEASARSGTQAQPKKHL